jgi:maleamate amidohydrolase
MAFAQDNRPSPGAPQAGTPGGDAARSPAWDRLLSDADRRRVAAAGFAQRVGFGRRPALLIVDLQNYMVGPPTGSSHAYPSACGARAQQALPGVAALAAGARACGAPVVYTRNEFRRDGLDMGVYRRKRGRPETEGWCLAGSEGAQIHDAVAAEPRDIVLSKCKPSAFFGTPLLGLLVDRGVDTVIVTGGSTSNCVRATAVDAASHNFRTIVVEDCVFDRFEISHLTALFDLDRQYADVVDLAAALAFLHRLRDDPPSESGG